MRLPYGGYRDITNGLRGIGSDLILPIWLGGGIFWLLFMISSCAIR